MNRFEALVKLNMLPEMGSIRLKRLLEFFEKPENILAVSLDELARIPGIGRQTASRIVALRDTNLTREFSLAKKHGVDILTWDDVVYPRNLHYIPDPPFVLYCKGNILNEDSRALAIVGSRRASFYGLRHAEQFAAALSAQGFTVISGMARGVDTYAHKGALLNRGRTIAVMGSGFARMYPAENKELAEQIVQQGAVLSEFPMETAPLRQNFPRRNRIISGLSLGVVVIEAARNSGALITADCALEQGKEVFALPGKVDCETSCGAHDLIKQGAKLITCSEDILEEFSLQAVPVKPRQEVAQAISESSQELFGGGGKGRCGGHFF